jgi:GntR family transcriptional regulator
MQKINSESSVPLYLQIVKILRTQIENGDLAEGERLESMKRAAKRWNVNFHTVRQAYQVLANEGLVTMTESSRGTIVNPKLFIPTKSKRALDDFLTKIRIEASENFGLSVSELIRLLKAMKRDNPDSN